MHVRRPKTRSRFAVLAQSSLLVLGLFAGNPAAPSSAATNYGLGLNGSSQYVTFGAAPGLGASQFTLELWFKRTGAGVGTSTGTGGIASAIPLITKGRAEAEGSNVDMNYFLGIDATSGKLVADFEEGTGGTGPLGLNHPVVGQHRRHQQRLAPRRRHVRRTTWKLYLDGNLDGTLGGQPAAARRQHPARRARHRDDLDRRRRRLLPGRRSTRPGSGTSPGRRPRSRRPRTPTSPRPQTGLIGHWGLNEGAGDGRQQHLRHGRHHRHADRRRPTWSSGLFRRRCHELRRSA